MSILNSQTYNLASVATNLFLMPKEAEDFRLLAMLEKIETIGSRLQRKADRGGYSTSFERIIYSQPSGLLAPFGLFGIGCTSPVRHKETLVAGIKAISDKLQNVDITLLRVQNTDSHDLGYDAHARVQFTLNGQS